MFNKDFLQRKVALAETWADSPLHYARNPTCCIVTPNDVCRVVAFLCTAATKLIVGQALYVDGSFSFMTDYFPALEHSLPMEKILP